jgi:hypothetical protein
MTDRIPDPYKTGTIIILHILNVMLLDRKCKDEEFWTEW